VRRSTLVALMKYWHRCFKERYTFMSLLMLISIAWEQTEVFSSLTDADELKLVPQGCGGKIHVNAGALKMDWPSDFFSSLAVFRSTLSRQYDAGCRPIIALFLAYSVSSARVRFNSDRLVVHSEIQMPNVQIPHVGLVGGTVDFITAPILGKAEMSTH